VSTRGQSTAWREEVNRRIAEHKNRKAGSDQPSAPAQSVASGSSRAAQAAARVAARYAKAPSYSQMQAEEARIAVRAAEIATQIALEAQSVAESALAELHAATAPTRPAAPVVTIPRDAAPRQPEPSVASEWDWSDDDLAPEPTAAQLADLSTDLAVTPAAQNIQPEPVAQAAPAAIPEPPAGPVTSAKDSSGNLLHIRWEPDMPLRETAAPASDPFDLRAEDWFTLAETAQPHEPAQIEAHAIHANLIQFPRELVATRRMRPRLPEGLDQLEQPGTQLSIFEVDPGSIQTEVPVPTPELAHWTPIEESERESEAAHPAANPVTWSTAEWHGMKLDAPAEPKSASAEAHAKPALASLNHRLMAGVIDFALVTGVAAFLWLTVALGMASSLAPRSAELLGASVFALAGLAYHAFFCLLSLRTPGMRYAGLSLCTFDECIPTQQQLRRRLGAMIVSMLPLGLGMVWSVFDEDRLSWHDRYSQTYLRSN
jgi:uncharacterized RDD family membrane protein YckC